MCARIGGLRATQPGPGGHLRRHRADGGHGVHGTLGQRNGARAARRAVRCGRQLPAPPRRRGPGAGGRVAAANRCRGPDGRAAIRGRRIGAGPMRAAAPAGGEQPGPGRRLAAPLAAARQGSRRALGGRRTAGVRRRHHRCARLRQVRRPQVEAGGDQHPRGGRRAVRAAAGPHRRRGTASLPRRARRPDRCVQPAGTGRASDGTAGGRKPRAGGGVLSRPGPAEADQRLPRPHRGRLVHPGVRAAHRGMRG